MQQVAIYEPAKQGNYRCFVLSANDPYQAVREAFVSKAKATTVTSAYSQTPIHHLVSIHNDTGMRDPEQVNVLAQAVRSGQNIIDQDGLPNLKMVIAPDGSLLVFDGHHTALAYLNSGKNRLSEVPHIIVSAPDFLPISSEEIASFFPPEYRALIVKDWRDYTVNWQAKGAQQIEQRQLLTIGELADALGNRNKAASQQ